MLASITVLVKQKYKSLKWDSSFILKLNSPINKLIDEKFGIVPSRFRVHRPRPGINQINLQNNQSNTVIRNNCKKLFLAIKSNINHTRNKKKNTDCSNLICAKNKAYTSLQCRHETQGDFVKMSQWKKPHISKGSSL